MTESRFHRLLRSPRRRPREAGIASAGVAFMLAGAAIAVAPWRVSPPSWPTATVRQGAYREVLVETGSVTSARLMLYGSRIAGSLAKISEIVPEGTMVDEGDVLVRFDPTVFEQELARETAALQQAEAELRRSREELRLASLQAAADLDRARRQIGYAESALADEADGSGRLALAEAQSAAAEAAREVSRTRAAFEDLEPMLAEGFITALELERAEQAWRRAEEQARLATLRLETLERYGRPAAVGRANAELHAAREAVARHGEAAQARLAEAQAVAALAAARVAEIEARITTLRDRLAQTVVTADGPGLVVYRDLFFGSDRRRPQVGDEVFSNQPLIALPDASRLVVDTRVREIDLHRIAASQAVHVTVDAYPDLRLPATVALVGALAQDDAARAGTKFFAVTVRLDASDPRLRPGMTARVEIEVRTLDDATLVPVHALFERDGASFCYVLARGRPAARPVTVVAENGLDAVVGAGLTAGDVVLLADPSAPEP